MAFMERENEILKTLQEMVDADLEFTVVGGYAVSALARHRFSVDCDIVIPRDGLGETEALLVTSGYDKNMERSGFDEAYSGKFIAYMKRVAGLPVTFDLLVDSLVCRATNASWSYEYIHGNSMEDNIAGLESSVRCRIPERELLISFKIHSGRRTDVRDIVMLSENADLEKIHRHIKRGDIDLLKDQGKRIREIHDDENLINSLKGVFTLTTDVEKQINNSKKMIDQLIKNMCIDAIHS